MGVDEWVGVSGDDEEERIGKREGQEAYSTVWEWQVARGP